MITQSAAPVGSLGRTDDTGTGNRLIPEPGGDTDNPREES
jgi:hypothetical protein